MCSSDLKRGLEEVVSEVARCHPGARVEVWAEDEARVGLLPTSRRTWSPCWRRPVACSRRRYQWNYVWGFVHPRSGRTEWFVTSTVSAAGTSTILQAFAAEVGAGPEVHIVLSIDGAGWHSADEVVVPDGLHLVFQPPYSPDVQPAERLWPLLRESLANRDFTNIDEHREVTNARCRELLGQPDIVRSRTLMHWWPSDLPARVSGITPERAAS